MDGTTDLPGKQMLDDNTLSADSKHLRYTCSTNTPENQAHFLGGRPAYAVGSFSNRPFSSCSLALRDTNHHHDAATATLAMVDYSHRLSQHRG